MSLNGLRGSVPTRALMSYEQRILVAHVAPPLITGCAQLSCLVGNREPSLPDSRTTSLRQSDDDSRPECSGHRHG